MQTWNLVRSEYTNGPCIYGRLSAPSQGDCGHSPAPPWVEFDLPISGKSCTLGPRSLFTTDRGSGQGSKREKLGAVPLLPPARMPTNSVGPGESISPPVHCPGRGIQNQPTEGVPASHRTEDWTGLVWALHTGCHSGPGRTENGPAFLSQLSHTTRLLLSAQLPFSGPPYPLPPCFPEG